MGTPEGGGAAGRRRGAVHYAGVFLEEEAQADLLAARAPLHATVHADHYTLLYRPTAAAAVALPLGCTVELEVTGFAANARVEAAAVQPPEWLPPSESPAPHITLSAAEGVPASEAGALVAEGITGCSDCFEPAEGETRLSLSAVVGVRLVGSDRVVTDAAEVLRAAEALTPEPSERSLEAMAHSHGIEKSLLEAMAQVTPGHSLESLARVLKQQKSDIGLAMDFLLSSTHEKKQQRSLPVDFRVRGSSQGPAEPTASDGSRKAWSDIGQGAEASASGQERAPHARGGHTQVEAGARFMSDVAQAKWAGTREELLRESQEEHHVAGIESQAAARLHAAAAQARERGDHESAKKLSFVARSYGEQAKQRRWDASVKAFSQLNSVSEGSEVLDLHSLGVSEALEAVMWTLAKSEGPRTLTIVVGKGLHSKAGKSRIAPAVLSLLKSRNLTHSSIHQGQIVVQIPIGG